MASNSITLPSIKHKSSQSSESQLLQKSPLSKSTSLAPIESKAISKSEKRLIQNDSNPKIGIPKIQLSLPQISALKASQSDNQCNSSSSISANDAGFSWNLSVPSINSKNPQTPTNKRNSLSIGELIEFENAVKTKAGRGASNNTSVIERNVESDFVRQTNRRGTLTATMLQQVLMKHGTIISNVSSSASRNASTIESTSDEELTAEVYKPTKRRICKESKARDLWQWAIQKVIKMIHTTNVIRDKNRIFRNEKLDPAALINSKLEFNAEMFKVGKRIGGSERITAALLKLPNDRTKSDILALEVMMKMLPGFSQYSLKGHVAQNFYYVLSGELEVFTRFGDKSVLVETLTPGQIFGEIALMGDSNQRRNATVISSTDVELLWICRDDFDAVLKSEIIATLEKRVKIISEHPFFSQFPSKVIHNLALTSQLVDASPNTVLVSEGAVPSHVFLLCKGQVNLSKCVPFSKVKTSAALNTFMLHTYPLPEDVKPQFGVEKVIELVNIAQLQDRQYYGAASAIASVGNASQVALMNTYFDTVNGIKSSFSLTCATQVSYLAISKYKFVKELTAFPKAMRLIATDFVTNEEYFNDIPRIQSYFLDRHNWLNHKENVMVDVVKSLKRPDAKKDSKYRVAGKYPSIIDIF
ncbi:hypothetical protein BCR33DRAFT_721796 [Rhizoclosmatium globosum]|uniref:Cyclic nucleotide-binding domain-containing protein n=1 Tax=Rhizoclosmatium globosum TaxID=329046 RepID=A0A1Y2BQ53_9FUNG|nr:hypothetical protein BCR33DRAFT_721796 [Rhizoclosmatium globosum]|eukprot:ORY36869.1 hypothetical protein BCR33DRAFT_721796 [Rhizoclosmatium globosum]